MTHRSGFAAFVATAIWLLVAIGGCNCGETASPGRDAGRDARVQIPIEAGTDADGAPEPRDADAHADVLDASVPLDAMEASVDATPVADADAEADLTAPDAGCSDGLTACPDPDTGRLVCVDLRWNFCHCGACNTLCDGCDRGRCRDCSLPLICGRGERCSADEEYVCTDPDNDPAHCGACWHACAADEICASGTCFSFFPDAGTDATPSG